MTVVTLILTRSNVGELNKKKQQSLLIDIDTTIVISISFWLHLIIIFLFR